MVLTSTLQLVLFVTPKVVMVLTVFQLVLFGDVRAWLELYAGKVKLCVVVVFNAEVAAGRGVDGHVDL